MVNNSNPVLGTVDANNNMADGATQNTKDLEKTCGDMPNLETIRQEETSKLTDEAERLLKSAARQRRHRKVNFRKQVLQYILIFVGALLTAVALQIFLVPNQVIDGGVVGISIMASYLSKLPLGLFIVVLNMPFVFIGYKQIGQSFAFHTLFALLALAFWTAVFANHQPLVDDILLAAIFGGIVLGLGVGLIIRNGGSLDGTEIIAIIIGKKNGLSVGEQVMFMNIFILSLAGLVFGWDKAMYSLIAYFVASKAIDITVEGINESKAVFIITGDAEEISAALLSRLGRGITVLEAKGGYSNDAKTVLYSVITRLEIAKLKAIVMDIDSNAFVTISDVHEVMGGSFRKRSIH